MDRQKVRPLCFSSPKYDWNNAAAADVLSSPQYSYLVAMLLTILSVRSLCGTLTKCCIPTSLQYGSNYASVVQRLSR